MQQKIQTLTKVASALNNAGITWALGGSAELHMWGLLEDFRDVDLMLAASDVEKAKQVFSAIDGLERTGYVDAYDLLQYRIDGMDFDVMQGFRFGEYAYQLRQQDVITTAVIDGVAIPLHTLQIWREFYRLMDRYERVALIDSYVK